MNEEELNIRSIGLRRARVPVVPTSLNTSVKVYKPRLEGDQKRDPLDTFIDKMEGIRPECPVKTIEDNWVKFTDWFVDITPPIKILPPKEEGGLEAELKYEIPRGVTYPALIPEFNRGDTVKATLTIRNTGTATARNVVGSVTVKTPAGASWLTVNFPKRDIAPGDSVPVSGTKTIASTDPLGTYTHSGSITCDNAPTVTISGTAFSVAEAMTTITITWETFVDEERGSKIATGFWIWNSGSVIAKNCRGEFTVYTPAGAVWLTQPLKPSAPSDIGPGGYGIVTATKTSSPTDPLGVYTFSAKAMCDNAPTVTKTGNAFRMVEAGTTIAATVGYTKT